VPAGRWQVVVNYYGVVYCTEDVEVSAASSEVTLNSGDWLVPGQRVLLLMDGMPLSGKVDVKRALDDGSGFVHALYADVTEGWFDVPPLAPGQYQLAVVGRTAQFGFQAGLLSQTVEF
jgi:hypothetical protein